MRPERRGWPPADASTEVGRRIPQRTPQISLSPFIYLIFIHASARPPKNLRVPEVRSLFLAAEIPPRGPYAPGSALRRRCWTPCQCAHEETACSTLLSCVLECVPLLASFVGGGIRFHPSDTYSIVSQKRSVVWGLVSSIPREQGAERGSASVSRKLTCSPFCVSPFQRRRHAA